MRPPNGDFRTLFRLRALIQGATALAVAAGAARAQEIAPFRLTDVSGSLTIGGWRDGQSTRQEGSANAPAAQSRTVQSDLRLGLFVDTRSYIYHPNLLTVEAGGGPIFEAASFVADGSTTRSSKTLYDLRVRARLLQDKPYRGSIFYQHLNPTLSVAPGDTLVTENERYGFDVSVLKPFTPVPVHLEVWRSTTNGRGVNRVVDDDTRFGSLRLDYSFGKDGYARASFTRTQQRSASGSPSLPIQRSDQNTESIELDAQTRFGADRQWLVQTPVTYFRQDYTLSQGQAYRSENLRAAVDLRGTHREGTLLSFARYDLNRITQIGSEGTLHALATSLAYTPDSTFSGTLGVRGEVDRRTELDSNRYDLTGSARYRRPIGLGTVTAGYSMLFGQRDQSAKAPTALVQGEQLVLAGTTPVALARTNVVPGSVRISNSNRTQTYVEGLDYVLDTLGTRTRVQRLAAGSIANGETVLADYSYDAGGTFAYRQFDNNFDIGWSIGQYAMLSLRYLDSAQTLLSGAPTTPLNSVRNLIASAQTDVPFRLGVEMAAGALVEWEHRRETILPYRRNLVQVYWQTLVPGVEWTGVRTGWRRSQINYDVADSTDVDLTAWDVAVWANTPWGINVSASYSDQRDTGGGGLRRERLAVARASWQYRRLSFALWGSWNRETQSGYARDRGRVDFVMKREF